MQANAQLAAQNSAGTSRKVSSVSEKSSRQLSGKHQRAANQQLGNMVGI